MPSFGIYTLANDVVFDQLVALINSIEVNVSPDIPVCIIPYDDRLDKVKQEIASRPNVTIFDNWESIQRWEDFAQEVWVTKAKFTKNKLSNSRWYGGHLQRKFVAFDGIFDKFVFYDADSLAMKPIDDIFEKLKTYDFVFDDWEHKKPNPVAALNISVIEKSGLFQEADIRPKLHCGSFWGSKQGFFDPNELLRLRELLIDKGEVKWINGNGWWDDSFLFNYMTLRIDASLFNFTLSSNPQERTGNCADADPFVNIDNVLYNEEGLKPIHRLHYMNYSSKDFARLCQGEDVNIRYKDIFLYYRFLKQPDKIPTELKPQSWLDTSQRQIQSMGQKLKIGLNRKFKK
ncbi:MAG TPA: methionine synthase [Cyanobacteria bacterium UBA11149]|nr:methionine synthase [Cyanobacteria bacterium UBA11367]HBE57774.1 methionine synthase [Cyanobacteria bacterium UBA11366]HBK62987.1 methionine synthase [Cyanobacteria bacterium UBA11166]HBR77255.1 methionine synthase [Cyanobacteria bacterium UBA11159]HBS69368.1 methionine synthase [Cyanobacteria bacterium UBA11153]HBW90111.1 methionine synthase [Cyanobacteria bacterium UBA11149]HCA97858.1 methionine synthase [Cyanobacteria bacterium UBA9226]